MQQYPGITLSTEAKLSSESLGYGISQPGFKAWVRCSLAGELGQFI